ncbi:MAG: hypothetical protein WA191_12070 [Telluria sp.]|nr:hypothetical protein [Telluria sp.]
MNSTQVWPYVSFVIGVAFSLLAQWISYRLSFKKDQKKEYWIRKLNSYQDFHQHVNQLIGLLRTNTAIPENAFWQSISLARKAAFDTAFFDWKNPERAKQMENITHGLINAYQGKTLGDKILNKFAEEAQGIQYAFYEDEKRSWKTSRLKAPDPVLRSRRPNKAARSVLPGR